MAKQLFANNAKGKLNANIGSGDLTAVLQAGQGALFPSIAGGDWFMLTLVDTSGNIEIVQVTARVVDTLTIVRAQEGTTARAFAASDKAELRWTKGSYERLRDVATQTSGSLSGLTSVGIAGGTVTVDTPPLDIAQTWNDGAVTFNGIKLNITSTASAAGSKLIDLQVGAASKFNVTRTGNVTAAGTGFFFGGTAEIGNAANAGVLSVYDSAGGTSYATLEIASNRADSDGGTVARLEFSSNSNSATYKTLAVIEVDHQGVTANQRGGQMSFYTRPNGSTTLTYRGSIQQGGDLVWGPEIYSGAGTVNVCIDAATGGTAALNFGINGVRKAFFYYTSSLFLSTDTTTDLIFGTNNTIRGRVDGVDGGFQIGAPTGGSKGSGTLNCAADVYKNGTAYTNPDYVLEHWATGRIEKYADKLGAKEYRGLMPLEEVERFARDNFCLPGFGQRAEHGLFDGSDKLLASVEEAYIHLFDARRRIAALEDRAK